MPKFEEIAYEGRCDVCGKQTDVAVCASSCGPISLAYCRDCLEAGLEPYGIMPDSMPRSFILNVVLIMQELTLYIKMI